MALQISTNHHVFDDKSGRHYVVQAISYDGTSTTVDLAEGPVDAVVLTSNASATKPTVTTSQSTLLATLAAGGTPGTYFLVSLHVGNAANL